MARKPVILRTPVTIRVPDHQAAQLRILARSQHQSVNRLLTPVITLFLEQHSYLLDTRCSRRQSVEKESL